MQAYMNPQGRIVKYRILKEISSKLLTGYPLQFRIRLSNILIDSLSNGCLVADILLVCELDPPC